MEIKFIDEVLPDDWQKPFFDILHIDAELVSILLFQPQGSIRIDGNVTTIGNHHSTSTDKKYSDFLAMAVENHVNLAVTPEYSCPLQVIEMVIKGELFPPPGKLWVLGTESMSKTNLNSFEELANNANAHFHFDSEVFNDSKHFVDPVLFAFQCKDKDNNFRRALILQFKCAHMGVWSDEREQRGLIEGNEMYLLRNDESSIHLLCLICSEAMSHPEIFEGIVKKHFNWMNHPYLVLHPQLNPKPQNLDFSRYRKEILSRQRENTELICLNWAQGTGETTGGKMTTWVEYSGSGLYLYSSEIDDSDDRFNENHEKGMYLVRGKGNQYFFCLNSDEGIFHFQTPKVSQIGAAAAQCRRSGPRVETMYQWTGEHWEAKNPVPCSFAYYDDYPAILQLFSEGHSPIDIERLFELSCGFVSKKSDTAWKALKRLYMLSFSESESIRRMTFTQDVSEEAEFHRSKLAQDFQELEESLIKNEANFPDHLKKFAKKNGGKIRFPILDRELLYEYNLTSDDGQEMIAVVNLGSIRKEKAKEKHRLIRKWYRGHNNKRLIVWYEVGHKLYRETDDGPVDIAANIPRYPSKELEEINRE